MSTAAIRRQVSLATDAAYHLDRPYTEIEYRDTKYGPEVRVTGNYPDDKTTDDSIEFQRHLDRKFEELRDWALEAKGA